MRAVAKTVVQLSDALKLAVSSRASGADRIGSAALPRHTGSAVSVLLSLFLAAPAQCQLVPVAAPARAQVRAIHLIAPGMGWAILDQHLFWTSDDGTAWQEITPSDHAYTAVDGAFFLDESHGWAAVRAPLGAGDSTVELFMASTSDAGRSWSYQLIDGSGDSHLQLYAGSSSIYFVDTLHGWLMVRLKSRLELQFGYPVCDAGRRPNLD